MYMNFWYPVCTSDELDEVNPQRIELLGSRLVAFRAESGTAHLLADTCIHRGGSLSRGTTKGECIQCPYHGWEFSGDGKCQHIPSIPDTKPPARAKVDSYPIQEKYGIVFAFLGDLPDEERPPLWEISEWGQEGWRAGKPAVREINCYYERSIENGLDPWHNEFVHPSQGLPKIQADSIKFTENEWGTYFTGDFGELKQKASSEEELQSDPNELHAGSLYHGPNTLITDIHFNATNAFIQYGFEAPIDRDRTRLYLVNMRNCMMDPEMDEKVATINARVADEDTVILEDLWPVRTPDTTTKELLTPGDEMVMRYRNHLKEWDAKGWRVDTKRMRETDGDVAYAIPCPDRRTSGNWILDPIPTIKQL
jgi:phenylpropionate dioxygenase-like ring-hydroxylating dioxygenase large terminal subunit